MLYLTQIYKPWGRGLPAPAVREDRGWVGEELWAASHAVGGHRHEAVRRQLVPTDNGGLTEPSTSCLAAKHADQPLNTGEESATPKLIFVIHG